MLQLLNDTWDAIVAIYRFIVGTIGGFIDYIVEFVKYIYQFLLNVIDSINDLINDFITINKICFEFIVDIFNSFIDVSVDIGPLLIDKITVAAVAIFQLFVDSCEYCYQSIADAFTTGITSLASANTFNETVYYCLYQSDIGGALTLISCGMTIWFIRKIIRVVTAGFIDL